MDRPLPLNPCPGLGGPRMRLRVAIRPLVGCFVVLVLAGEAGAQGPPCQVPAAGVPCSDGCTCEIGHDIPCRRSTISNLNQPLPPISFSRYAANGDYDCTRSVY